MSKYYLYKFHLVSWHKTTLHEINAKKFEKIKKKKVKITISERKFKSNIYLYDIKKMVLVNQW